MFKKTKRAYTLTEMMVVMGIMALIMLLGALGMSEANNDNMAEQTAQGILSQIREAQTRAISITKDSQNNSTKVWTVRVPSSNLYPDPTTSLISYYSSNDINIDRTYTETASSSRVTPAKGVTIHIQRQNSDGSFTNQPLDIVNNAYITFSTPFARSHTTLNDMFLNARPTCAWKVSKRPEKDFEIYDTTCPEIVNSNSSIQGIRIKVTYKDKYVRYIYVKKNGDAYVQAN